MPLNIQQFIRRADEEIHKLEVGAVGANNYRQPEFPMLVVYLGSDTKAHTELSEHLCRLWPAYRNDLRFIEVRRNGDEFSLTRLAARSEERQPIAINQLSDVINELFDTKNNFNNLTNMIIYYLLDTTPFTNPDELYDWMDAIRRVEDAMDVNKHIMNSLLFLMLHGGVTRQSVYKGIRERVADFADGNAADRFPLKNIVVISKYLDNGNVMSDWSVGYKIVAASIALSNDCDARIRSPFFAYPVVTPYYSIAQESTQEIGQVMVTKLLNTLARQMDAAPLQLASIPNLKERLGKEKDGTFTFLNEYVQAHINRLLPKPEQLVFFPRREPDGYTDLECCTAREFDDYTMGAWSAFLKNLAERMIHEIQGADWKNSYTDYLHRSFTPSELRCLNHNYAQVARLLQEASEPTYDGGVLIMARNYLQYYLSSRPSMLRLLNEALRQSGEIADEYDAMWRGLIESQQEVHMTDDRTIITFYSEKVRAYFDQHPVDTLVGQLQHCRNESELEAFVNEQLDQLIRGDNFFAQSFADKLASILAVRGLPLTPAQYIHESLSNGHTYLHTTGQFGAVAGSPAILMDTDQKTLFDGLRGNLNEVVLFYDTCDVNSVEYLQMRHVTGDNLRN